MHKKFISCLIASALVISVEPIYNKSDIVLADTIENQAKSFNFESNKLYAVNTYKSPKMDIENPRTTIDIRSKSYKVSGWALNDSIVKQINVYIDNTLVGQATIGLPRPDVTAVYSGYNGGSNCGYEYTIDTSKLSIGSHTLKVTAVGNDNSTIEKSVAINIVKPIPRMDIENPRNSLTFSGKSYKISGWALNDSVVKQVNVFLDNKLVGQANYGKPRPDVTAVYSGYNGGSNIGYDYDLDLSKVGTGNHTLTVKSIGNDTSVSEKSVDVYINSNIPMPRMDIESPSSSLTLTGKSYKISGWALNSSSIKQVDVYLDNIRIGQANYGLPRADVTAVYSTYGTGSNCGYNYDLDLANISKGNHALKVTAVGNDGAVSEKTVSINIDKLQPRADIESPRQNTTVSTRSYKISGWALNDSSIKQIDVYVDGTLNGHASLGISRPDVTAVYSGYSSGPNCGYDYDLDITKLISGTHTITIKAIGNDNSVTERSSSINVVKPQPKMDIEYPGADGSLIIKTVTLSGWALNDSGISQIHVYVDDILVGDATPGLSRPDVDAVYSGYLNGITCGYNFTFDSTKIKNGSHTLKVVSYGVDGSSVSKSKSINVMNNDTIYTNYTGTISQVSDIQYRTNSSVYYDSTKQYPWVSASKDQIAYYLNPQNFSDDYGKYQFLKLNYTYGITAADLDGILIGKGVLQGKGSVFLKAAQDNNISPVYLVSHALLETGNGTSALATGINVTQVNGQSVEPKVVYNMFGIYAFDSDPNRFGSEYAYIQGWTSVDSAILGGAKWISNQYINNSFYKQDTLYKMRWNPSNPGTHQYATDISWAYNQIYNIKRLTDKCKNAVLIFDIPVYQQ